MPKRVKRKAKSSKRNPFFELISKYKFIFIISLAVSGLLFYTKFDNSSSSVLGTTSNSVEILSESQAQFSINSQPKSTACGNPGQEPCPKYYFTKIIVFDDENKNIKRGDGEHCYIGNVTFTVNGIDYKTYQRGCTGTYIRSKLKKNKITAPADFVGGSTNTDEWKVLGLNYKDPTTNGKYVYKKGKRSQEIVVDKPNLLKGSYLNFSYVWTNRRADPNY